MNNFNMNDTRSRRNLLNWTGIFPFQSVANYSSDSSKMKMDIKNNFGEDLYLNHLHLIPDPLKKNLADSIITGEVKTKTNMASETKTFVNESKIENRDSEGHHTEFSPPLGGITNFLSGVMNFVSGLAMFHKRTDSPTQYYECFEQNLDGMAPSLQAWHTAKPEVQNKNGRAHNDIISTNEPIKIDSSNVNSNCRMTAAQCENKLSHVFLENPHLSYQSHLHSENPKAYVEQSSFEDCYEDAFTCDDFETLSDQTYLEYFGPFRHKNPELLISDAPRIKTEYVQPTENMDISTTLTPYMIEHNAIPDKISVNSKIGDRMVHEPQIVEACEDKMNKLKALLQEKLKNKCRNEINNSADNIETIKDNEHQTKPISIPNSNNNKQTMKSNKREDSTSENDVFWNKSIDENIANGLRTLLKSRVDDQDCSDSSPEYLDPCNYFDEVTGRFYSASVESDDSFQIVFTDGPRSCRGRMPSECESEDSFIVFEDSPDSCYSSKDVFGDEINVNGFNEMESSSDSDSDEEYDDSDSESDSGCDAFNQTCKLSHSLTRTIGDLTDDSLYKIDEDEVDCAAMFVQEKHIEHIWDEKQINIDNIEVDSDTSRGLLVDEKRKLEKGRLPKKTVRFSEKPPKVHVMRVWAFAARQARAGHWERHALDRERFKRRIADVEMAVSWVLKPQHRARVMFQRFMPWWNAQKRKELAESEKKKEEQQKEVRDATSEEKQDAELQSESDLKKDEVKIENNFGKYNCEAKILNGNKNMQTTETPNSAYEAEAQVKISDKMKMPNGRIRKNGQILRDNQVVIVKVDKNINVLKFGYEDNTDIDT